jgi:hypothetical protein
MAEEEGDNGAKHFRKKELAGAKSRSGKLNEMRERAR